MIASLHGIVQSMSENSVVVRVGGVGLRVSVPGSVLSQAGGIGQQIDLLTYLVVREDALTLYGFQREEEQVIFEMLLGVSGIGPRLALSVINTLTPEMIANAIQRDDAEVLSRVPGIGKKTAQKIVLDLKGKLLPESLPAGIAAVTSLDADVIEVLTAMGFSIVEAQAALQSIPRDAPEEVEERVKLALNYFAT